VTPPPTELGELEAMRSLYSGCEGAHVAEAGGALCTVVEGMPRSAMFNRALGLGIGHPVSDNALDEIGTFFSRHGVAYGITLTPDAEPPDLPQRLVRRGFARGYAWQKFTRDTGLAPAAPTDLTVERVGPERAAEFGDVFVRAYGTPRIVQPLVERLPSLRGWHCFVAFSGGEPAATGALFVTGGVGWLGIAGTLPEHRGRGAQSAIVAARIEAARGAGCTVVVTETGAPVGGDEGPSYRNLVRAGFEPAYVRENYLSAADSDTSGTVA
jgi:GNAT superfamily N-acetyltransferase